MKPSKGASSRTLRATATDIGPVRRIGIRRARTLRSTGRRGLHDLLELYRNLSGYHVGTLGYSQYPTAYGEVTEKGIQALSELFQSYAPGPRHFFDLGCGIGRALLGMAIIHPGIQCHGIEIVPERVRIANQALERFRTPSIVRRIRMEQGDFLEPTFSLKVAHWVFISNTVFDDDTQVALMRKLEADLPSGAVVICSKQFPLHETSPLKLLETGRIVPMSWSATSTCSVYKKAA